MLKNNVVINGVAQTLLVDGEVTLANVLRGQMHIGLTSFVNPELGKKIVADRINESTTDYVAYCAMCRDNFASQFSRPVKTALYHARGFES